MVVYRDDCRELLAEFPVTDCTAESLFIAQEISVLVVGTSKGTVRLYGWPIDESACLMEVVNVQLGQVRLTPPVFTELQVHRRHVSRVEVSDDSRYVVTGGDDGSIMVLEMTGMDERRTEKGKDQLAKAKEERKKLMGIMNNLFLMKSSDVQSKN
jgi:sRNA-binding carbon storage regulator CsrA